jgi:hypothetical protein
MQMGCHKERGNQEVLDEYPSLEQVLSQQKKTPFATSVELVMPKNAF